MLRQIMIPDQEQIIIELPKEYVHQTIEILAFRLSEAEPLTVFSEEDFELDENHES